MLLLKPVDIQYSTTVCVLLERSQQREIGIISFTLGNDNIKFGDKPVFLYTVLDETILKNDYNINDMDMMFLSKPRTEDASSLFYFQFKLSSSCSHFFVFTYGLFRANLTGVNNNMKLDNRISALDTLTDFPMSMNAQVFKYVMNKGYYCIYAKPITNLRLLVFDYIFYKNYVDDKVGRIVFFSLKNDGKGFNIKELRVSEDFFQSLTNVIPIISLFTIDKIKVLLKRRGSSAEIVEFKDDIDKIDDDSADNFNFAAKSPKSY